MEKLIELKFKNDELAPTINKETIDVHHGKHLATYVANYNAAIEGTEYENQSLIEVMTNIEKVDITKRTAINNNGGGVLNHNIYFEQLGHGELSDGTFKQLIIETFGSLENMIEELKKAGLTRFGSGWSWLVLEDGVLKVTQTLNQDCPYSLGQTPLLAIDVWEHAYYLDYQNRRAEYLNNIFSIIDWTVVEKRFGEAKK